MNQNSPELLAAWDNVPLAKLMDHIVQTHHVFCRREAPRIGALLKEALDKHGKNHPAMKRIQMLFSRMSNDLSMHLLKEEQTLFPYIARVEDAVAQKNPVSWPPFGTVANPIRMMVLEHDQTGEELKEIRKLSHECTPSADAGNLYTALYDGLSAFERDMQEHIEIENDFLFPRAVALEERACARQREAMG